jgi:hypothetical protein
MDDLALIAQMKSLLDVELGQCVAASGPQNDDMAILMLLGTLVLGWLALAWSKIKQWLKI